MSALYQATVELGISSKITTFTLSDFSRTLQPASNVGSDHAWGSHQMIMGGAVKGGQMYGTFPTLALGGPDDAPGTAGGFRPLLSINTAPRWQSGLGSAVLTFPIFSRTSQILLRAIWDSLHRSSLGIHRRNCSIALGIERRAEK